MRAQLDLALALDLDPALAFALALAYGALHMARKGLVWQRGIAVLSLVVVLLCSSLSMARNQIWGSDLTLWRDAAEPMLVICPHPDDARRLVEQLEAKFEATHRATDWLDERLGALRKQADGYLFDVITNGSQSTLMGPYKHQVGVRDRWAIVAYVRALQRSQHATAKDVPAERK